MFVIASYAFIVRYVHFRKFHQKLLIVLFINWV